MNLPRLRSQASRTAAPRAITRTMITTGISRTAFWATYSPPSLIPCSMDSRLPPSLFQEPPKLQPPSPSVASHAQKPITNHLPRSNGAKSTCLVHDSAQFTGSVTLMRYSGYPSIAPLPSSMIYCFYFLLLIFAGFPPARE